MIQALDLVPKMLAYSPSERVLPLNACIHPFFDELRDPNARLPNGEPLPPSLFDFTQTERDINPSINDRLIPRWRRSAETSESTSAAESNTGAADGDAKAL